MKILLTGGGTGGHFYPIIAVAQSINNLARTNKLADVKLYYMAPVPYDERMLFENNITFVKSSGGKIRRYFSLMNIVDAFRTLFGCIGATWKLFWLYPDVVFGKGGYASFPALFAAWVLHIPVVIHESDSEPGKVNKWAGFFARKVALSYPEAAPFFLKNKIAFTGNPIRQELLHSVKEGSREFLHLESNIPVILFLGGSMGAQAINDVLLDVLPKLVEKYQIIHQTGKDNFQSVQSTAAAMLLTSEFKGRYLPFDTLNSLSLRMAAGVADLIVTRAGSTLFEIAVWGVPAIIIPIPQNISHDQTKNAYSYARTGAAVVVEQTNLTPNILRAEIDRLMENSADREKMRKAAEAFAHQDAGDLIAQEILSIGLEHEK